MKKRYTALRIVGTIYKILGGITGILAILSAIGIFIAIVLGGVSVDQFGREYGGWSGNAGVFGGILGGFLISLLVLIGGILLAIPLFAIGEGIYLLIAMEENTRATAEFLQAQGFSPPA